MALWTSMGHAMRRRMGAPSSHLESAGKSMNRSVPTTEEILASAAHAKSPRRYMGMDVAKSVEAVAPERGTPVAKKNTQAGDPTIANKANKKNVLVNSAVESERLGARYSISVKFPEGHDPAAAATMGSARVIKSVSGRQTPNFADGIDSTH